MEKEFVSYEIAIALKELKYDGDYNYTYTIDKHLWYGNARADGIRSLAAPLKQQVFRWFREKYELFVDIYPLAITASDKTGYRYSYLTYNLIDGSSESDSEIIGHYTYEEAENACIDKLIELAKYLY